MKTLLLSSLAKVFKDTEPNFPEYSEASALKNERFSFQLAVLPEKKCEEKVTVEISTPLKDVKLYVVENIPSELSCYENHDSFHYDISRTEFPDLLRPAENTVALTKGEWTSLWIEYVPAKKAKTGKKKITITLKYAKSETVKTFNLNVIDEALPKQELLYTNWFHNDCLCTRYGVEPFSDEYWRIAENYIKNAVEHGMTMILTPVFTPPLDTEIGGERPTIQLVDVKKTKSGYEFGFDNFEKYVSICLKNGILAFEISHLFTQWGALAAPKIIAEVNGKQKRIFGWETKSHGKAYTEFLEAFSTAFIKEVKKLGIKDRCWLHVSDEPGHDHIKDYKKTADTVHRLFKGFHTFDAMSDIDFYRNGLVETPVCGIEHCDLFKKEVKNFWTYHCCGHVREFVPNRLFAQPSLRNRILGVLLYKYDAQGFLQWGHNFWFSQYSRFEIDPFKVTDTAGAFPSGDAFMVYPGDDGAPLNSLRHVVFSDGMQDLRALRLLEKLTSRKHVLQLIEEGLDVPLTFKTYPHEQEWLLALREKINGEIAANIKQRGLLNGKKEKIR